MMRPALFLHIQKTAGTSIQVMARHAYGNDGVCSHGDFIDLGVAGCAPFPFVSGHFGFSFAERLMPGRYCFTFLRDPVDRLVSLYQFYRSRPPEENYMSLAAHDHDFGGFLALSSEMPARNHLWNHITWQMAFGWGNAMASDRHVGLDDLPPADLLDHAVEHLAAFDHVGFVDSFSEDVATIFTQLGAPSLDPLRENVTASRDDHLTLKHQEEDRLLEMTVLDRKLYEIARQRFRPAAAPGGDRPGRPDAG